MTRKQRREYRRFMRLNRRYMRLCRGLAEHCDRERVKLIATMAKLQER